MLGTHRDFEVRHTIVRPVLGVVHIVQLGLQIGETVEFAILDENLLFPLSFSFLFPGGGLAWLLQGSLRKELMQLIAVGTYTTTVAAVTASAHVEPA